MKTIEQSADNMSEPLNTCAICLDKLYMTCRLTGVCGHRFCFECLFKWSKVQNLCPLCQRQYQRLDNRIASETQLNRFERILVGIKREINLNRFALRKLLKNPKWKDLDHFWHRLVSTSIVCKRKIVIVLVIDANEERNGELLEQRVKQIIDSIRSSVEDDSFGNVIDGLLKNCVNNIHLMTLIVCCRRRTALKK